MTERGPRSSFVPEPRAGGTRILSNVPGVDTLTAVVTNWGTPDLTIRSARALITDGVPAERVVVVDNGSEDNSHARFQTELAGCRLVRLERNVGYGGACNIGAARLPGETYLLVNNDAFVHAPGSVGVMLGCLDDEEVGIVAPLILNEDLTLQPSVVPTNSPGVALVRASGLSRLVPNRFQPAWSTHWDHASSREIQAINGAALLVRGAVWEELGGFDERIYMYAEDLDLCWRARRRGWKVWFTPRAVFVHLGSFSSAQRWSSPQRAEMMGRAEAAMIHRHMSRLAAWLTVGFISAGLAARWVFFTITRRRDAAATLRRGLRGYLVRDG
jgi:N-acetylglucosaminyl-diphospho-decaprenol L-rhamnosyltransferase